MTDNLINLQYTTIKSQLPKFIYESIKEYSANSNSYQSQPKELVGLLAKKHNISSNMIFLTAGIDEAIQLFAKTHGKHTIVFTPSYIVYADVEEFGGVLTKIPSIVNGAYNVIPKTFPNVSLIFLANPNNPAGFTKKEIIIELIERNRTAYICIDEAYGEFAPDLSIVNLVSKYDNLVVFRSFSKDYGMAGNRIGYIIAQPTVLNTIRAKTQWCNVSYLSVGAAVTALKHEEYFIKIRKNIHVLRKNLEKALQNKGLKLFSSYINASLIKFTTKEEAEIFMDHLAKHNIKVSLGNGDSNIGLDDTYVRIAIGTKNQMRILEEVINNY